MTPAPTNALVRKLSIFARLTEDEIQTILGACTNVRTVEPMEVIVAEGEEVQGAKLILDGIGCRYKTLEDGRRQIVSYFIPGDTSDLRRFLIRRMDHSIGALSSCRVATLSRDALHDVSPRDGPLHRALHWTSLVEESISRE